MMNFFKGQLANVIEWDEFRDDMIFWKWGNNEIKKGSKLIVRPGQDAIFFNHGRIEGIFEDAGDYDVDSQIIPVLSTLKGFKFGFNTGMRCEVLFVNTKEFTVKWGTKSPIHLATPELPGGMPIRANGTFNFKVTDYIALIDQVAGVRNKYLVEDIRTRIVSILNQLLMKWIGREGKDKFNLQAYADQISAGIKEDLDMELTKDGMTITGFYVNDFNYPKEVEAMVTKAASHSMVTDVGKYQQMEMTDGMASGKMSGGGSDGGSTATDMAGMMMGMNIAKDMMGSMNDSKDAKQQHSEKQSQPEATVPDSGGDSTSNVPNFCPNCGEKTAGANFCGNCGHKLA